MVAWNALDSSAFAPATRLTTFPELLSGRYYAGTAAIISNEPHNGNWAWLSTLRRWCVRFILRL